MFITDLTLTIIGIAFLTLTVIIYLKLWILSTRFNKLQKYFLDPDYRQLAERAYQRGDSQTAKKFLDKSLHMALKRTTADAWTPYETSYKYIIHNYTIYYKNMELELPDFDKYKDPNIFRK